MGSTRPVRVGEIQTTEGSHDFYLIAGRKNIVDRLSRGSTPDTLLEHSEWQQGPEFLQWLVQEWPLQRRPLLTFASICLDQSTSVYWCLKQTMEKHTAI